MCFFGIDLWEGGGRVRGCGLEMLLNTEQGLMGHSCRSLVDQKAEGNVDSERLSYEPLKGSKDAIGIWDRGHSDYTLAKNLATLYSQEFVLG